MITFAVRPGTCQSCATTHLSCTHFGVGPASGPRAAQVALCPECVTDLGLAIVHGTVFRPIGDAKKRA